MGRKQSALKRLLQGAKGTRREQTGVLFVDCWHFSRSPQRARIAPATISPGQKKITFFFLVVVGFPALPRVIPFALVITSPFPILLCVHSHR